MEHFNKNILPGEYLYAMKKFLINCDTPTTIALQGEWGSGKTTFWKLLKNTSIRKLYENYIEELPDELSEIGEQNDEKLYFLNFLEKQINFHNILRILKHFLMIIQ